MVLMYEWELYTDLNTCIGNLCCCSSTLMWILFYKWNVFSIGNLKQFESSSGRSSTKLEVVGWYSTKVKVSNGATIGQVQYIVLNYLKVTWESLTPTPRQIFKNITVYTGWTLRPLVQFILLSICLHSVYISLYICNRNMWRSMSTIHVKHASNLITAYNHKNMEINIKIKTNKSMNDYELKHTRLSRQIITALEQAVWFIVFSARC